MPGKRNTRLRDSERLLKQSDNIPNTILCMDLLSHCCRSLPHGLIRVIVVMACASASALRCFCSMGCGPRPRSQICRPQKD